MRKLVLIICVVMLAACAGKQETVKTAPSTETFQPNIEQAGKKVTKWDEDKLKGLNKESIGEQSIKEGDVNVSGKKSGVESATIKEEITKIEQNDIHFDLDDYKIKAEDIPTLEAIAQWMGEHPEYKLTIEGNCDERGSDLYNLALGEKRAYATKNFLVSLGVPPEKIDCISYGEEKPLDPGHNEAAWAKNRRCHFVLSK